MRHARKLGLAALLLVGGLAIANLFRREAPPSAVDPAADLVLRHPDGPRVASGAASAPAERPIDPPAAVMPPALPPSEKPTGRRKRRDRDASMVRLSPFTWADPAPPAIEWEYPGASPAPRRSWNSSAIADWSMLADDDGTDPGEDDAPFADVFEDSSMRDDSSRRHTIVDGDTLAALALRYLDDAQRADELFRANRDVLSDPQLLPIGGVLRIPARQPMGVDSQFNRPLVPVMPSAEQ